MAWLVGCFTLVIPSKLELIVFNALRLGVLVVIQRVVLVHFLVEYDIFNILWDFVSSYLY